ncbi:hypothetical protein A9R05_09425 [Burkholderia sp. KK1]|uniref:DUF1839 family protein n=1 Tax=unclassified Caballeronia TaxID=2646786 RepID=UPI0002EE7283|nr:MULTISPECIES: DUF1839 family protein [unclassified Caballeronia]AQG99025.1 hypothetical protein A9R05_09425 [Burkholderia sp. KK1]MCE4541516.1 DUF1839 family protein [Caballeronia sp. PC1]MCE4569440.1 DUF1839 family protein [Caballeronia sp. CLC5]BBP96593.1 hypothetical protein BSFA1_17220 [Burkholderia sp. SFA1]
MSAFHTSGVTNSGASRSRVVSLDPLRMRARRHHAHALHRGERIWREGFAPIDLWIELLHGNGLEPRAALAFTVAQDFEADQFTLGKLPYEDIEKLYGLQVQELAVFDSLEERALVQTRRANTVLVEVDAFFLPDMRAVSYHREHAKTTIGIDVIDPDARRLGYFHHTGYHLLDGDDYDGVLRPEPSHDAHGKHASALFPHVEFVKRVKDSLAGTPLAETSADLLCMHLLRRPMHNPISRWRAAFPEHVEAMIARGENYAHLYAFNVMRQLGANFELLAHYLHWMREQGFDIPVQTHAAARKIASETMVMQCRLARAISRGRREHCEASFDVIEDAYERVIPSLANIVC